MRRNNKGGGEILLLPMLVVVICCIWCWCTGSPQRETVFVPEIGLSCSPDLEIVSTQDDKGNRCEVDSCGMNTFIFIHKKVGECSVRFVRRGAKLSKSTSPSNKLEMVFSGSDNSRRRLSVRLPENKDKIAIGFTERGLVLKPRFK